MKFIDLFAGIGGFHLALTKLGLECVFASELDEGLSNLYAKNFELKPKGDIKKVNIKDIPSHDVLCAGFPCQPFSKAGKMLGTDHYYGDLFAKIAEILEVHQPTYFILENVAHLKKQGNAIIWNDIQKTLIDLGYNISDRIYSPHQFGIPQHRQRVYIVGSKNGLDDFKWMIPSENITTDIRSILDINPVDAKPIGKKELECLELWQEFIDCIPSEVAIPGFPIWGMEFGATYPLENGKNATQLTELELGEYKGVFGKSLKGMTKVEQYKLLPSHAFNTDEFGNYPDWKKNYINQSRNFYTKYKKELSDVVIKISKLATPSWHKLEWNVGDRERKIKNYIIQFRASGIRLKKTETSPSLVCATTQIPIIGWENRYITIKEGARLQSIENIALPDSFGVCFKALGNAVNVEIVYQIAQELLMPKIKNPKKKLEQVCVMS